MSQVAEHLTHLADVIGPRPATTDAEARAADYIEGVFRSRDLEVERQEFDCPRTDAWAFGLVYLLAIIAAVVSRWFPWPALVVAAAVPVLLLLELDTRSVLARILPKGPSQNVIARYVPRLRRGERLRRVIVVAHYDTAKSSAAASPGIARRHGLITRITLGATVLVPVVILIRVLPFLTEQTTVLWYVTLAAAAVLLFPLGVLLERELLGKPVDGANDNASGVAALLGIMERLVPDHQTPRRETQSIPVVPAPVRRSAEVALEADVVPDDALLTYTPVVPPAEGLADTRRAAAGTFDDLGWDDGGLPPARSTGQSSLTFGDAWDEEEPAPSAGPSAAPSATPSAAPSAGPSATPAAPREEEHRGLRDWLGVGKNFDARKEGRRIGSWERFDEDEDDDFGFKGGSAGEPDFEDPDFAAEEAARIRRRVTSGVDRALTEKEVWFVATGAEESGAWGMRAFLDAYGEDVRDALIINLDTIGAGSLAWVTREGVVKPRHADRRLSSAAKRIAREDELSMRGREFQSKPTDTLAALARGYKAMSIMAFDINGRLANWHRPTDTVDLVQPENVEQAVEFATKLIRGL